MKNSRVSYKNELVIHHTKEALAYRWASEETLNECKQTLTRAI